MTHSIAEHIAAKRRFGQAVCQQIGESIARLGYALQTPIKLPDYDAAEFSLVKDPYSQSQDLVGHWYDARKQRVGLIKFHGDGSFYAEYDVVQPHPSKQNYFVEAINAWGRENAIKTEAKLLEMQRD